MSVKQASIHVVRMRFVTITWDHTTAAAVLVTLEMDKHVLVIVKFLLIGCYYIFFGGYVHNSFKILLRQRCKKKKNQRTNEIIFRRLGNIKPQTIIKEWIQAVLKSLSSCIHSCKFRVL